jgi:endoglucanase
VTTFPRQEGSIFDKARQIGRGVNLGNALEAPSEGEWGVVLDEEYFRLIREGRFNSVRIPIRWSAHAQAEAPFTIDPEFLARVDWAVEQALKNGLVAIVNMHHYEEMIADPAAHTEALSIMWSQIAEHFQDSPDTVYFGATQRAEYHLDWQTWNKVLKEAIAIIRQTNPDRPIVIGPVNWNSVTQLTYMELPKDDHNLIGTFHYYEPFHFTHQGAEWASGSEAWMGTTWEGTQAEQQAILDAIQVAASWSQKTKRPVYLGEFGAYYKADMDSRQRWTDFVARQAEVNDISWAYWEFCSGFGLRSRTKAME